MIRQPRRVTVKAPTVDNSILYNLAAGITAEIALHSINTRHTGTY